MEKRHARSSVVDHNGVLTCRQLREPHRTARVLGASLGSPSAVAAANQDYGFMALVIGAQTIVEALVTQARGGGPSVGSNAHVGASRTDALRRVSQMAPGLGEPTPVELDASSAAVGKSLADLNLRGITGATVLAITRGEEGLIVPTSDVVLRAGDVVALAGTRDAVDAARRILARASDERA